MPISTIMEPHDKKLSLPEIIESIKFLSSGNTPGSDAISAEIYQMGRLDLVQTRVKLFQLMWNKIIPREFRDGSIVYLKTKAAEV